MKFLAVSSLALLGVATFANAQVHGSAARPYHSHHHAKKPVSSPPGVRATFTTNISGAQGSVTLTDRTDITADITITDFDRIKEVDNWQQCTQGGIIWSLQSDWPDSGPNEMFGEDCDYDNTGGYYDPTYQCGSASQYFDSDFCVAYGPNFTLFQDINYLEGESYDFFPPGKPSCDEPEEEEYNCYPCLYEQYSFACQTGDFSGKYGNLRFHGGCAASAAGEEAVSGEEAAEPAAANTEVDAAAGYHHCHPGSHVHFKVHDRFMDKPSLYRARSIRLSCNDGTVEGKPLMCAKLLPFTDYHQK